MPSTVLKTLFALAAGLLRCSHFLKDNVNVTRKSHKKIHVPRRYLRSEAYYLRSNANIYIQTQTICEVTQNIRAEKRFQPKLRSWAMLQQIIFPNILHATVVELLSQFFAVLDWLPLPLANGVKFYQDPKPYTL